MVTSNLGHCFMGYFFILLQSFELGWTELAITIFFSESSCETKSRGKKLSHFLFSFGGRFWRSKKWVSWLWAVIFQCKYDGNNKSSIPIRSEMLEPLCLCMWWSCWYDLTTEDWWRSSQFCPFLEQACCWLMRLIWDRQVLLQRAAIEECLVQSEYNQ